MKSELFQKESKVIFQILEPVSAFLNQVHILGKEQILEQDVVFLSFVNWLEIAERDLLEFWKVGSEDPTKIDRWRSIWLSQELRESRGWLKAWNRFVFAYRTANENMLPSSEGNSWGNYVLFRVTDQFFMKKIWSRLFENEEDFSRVLNFFQDIYCFNPDELHDQLLEILLSEQNGCFLTNRICFSSLSEIGDLPNLPEGDATAEIMSSLRSSGNWSFQTKVLRSFWREHSGGLVSQTGSFVLELHKKELCMRSIPLMKNVGFEHLHGIDENTQALIHNIEQWIAGGEGGHVLLWGARGTGKSSSVLSLAKYFSGKEVKLVEMRQSQLKLIRRFYDFAGPRPEKFIVFIDDLSFSQKDEAYKHLKSALEGSFFACPRNIIFHVTTNRRDLVDPGGEIEYRDARHKQFLDEMRALDDRFRLKLFYDNPQFDDLSELLFACADKEKGFVYERKDLLTAFNRFCLQNQHDKPAGRSVRYFLDSFQSQETHVSTKKDEENK